MPEVVIFIGLQASGKTTFYRERYAATHAHISKDLMGRTRTPREARQLRMLEEALRDGLSVVIDNTNAAAADRAASIAVAKQFGARVVACYFKSHLPSCIRRNSEREGKACVPDVALIVTSRKLEAPSETEGFDEILKVSIAEGGGFIVQPWER